MADYSAMKSYPKKNDLQYFTFSPYSEKPFKAVIRHLPGMPTEDISNSLQDLGFNVINVRQLTTNQKAANGQTHVETLLLFLVTLTRNMKSQEIFELNSLNHIIIKVELYRAQTGLKQLYKCQNFGHVWANCKQPLDVCGCSGSHLHKECPRKDEYRITELLQLHTSRRETSSSVISRMQLREKGTAKEKNTTSSQGILWEDFFLYVHLTTVVLRSCTASRQTTSATTNNADRTPVSNTKVFL
jgi:hypothetical protein